MKSDDKHEERKNKNNETLQTMKTKKFDLKEYYHSNSDKKSKNYKDLFGKKFSKTNQCLGQGGNTDLSKVNDNLDTKFNETIKQMHNLENIL